MFTILFKKILSIFKLSLRSLFYVKMKLWLVLADHSRKNVFKTCISLVISPEIRKWVKIWSWGFFRDDEKSSKYHSNYDFFVSAGVFCSKLLFSAQKYSRKNFLKILSKDLFITPPQIWWSKKSSNFEHRDFWWHVPGVCTYCDCGQVTLIYSKPPKICFTLQLHVLRKLRHILSQHLRKKVLKTGGG